MLSTDQRINQITREGIPYTDEGMYTFTVSNLFTGSTTTKTIYVGTDKYFLALSKNVLTVEALNERIMQGATIGEDGTIADYIPPEEPELPEPLTTEEPKTQPVMVVDIPPADKTSPSNPVVDISEPVADGTPQSGFTIQFIAGMLVAIVSGVFVTVAIMKKTKKKEKRVDV